MIADACCWAGAVKQIPNQAVNPDKIQGARTDQPTDKAIGTYSCLHTTKKSIRGGGGRG